MNWSAVVDSLHQSAKRLFESRDVESAAEAAQVALIMELLAAALKRGIEDAK